MRKLSTKKTNPWAEIASVWWFGVVAAIVAREVNKLSFWPWLIAFPTYVALFGVWIAWIYKHASKPRIALSELDTRELEQRRAAAARHGETWAVCVKCGDSFCPGSYPDPKCGCCRSAKENE